MLKFIYKSWLSGAMLEKSLKLSRPSGMEPTIDQPHLMLARLEEREWVSRLLSFQLAGVLLDGYILWRWIYDPRGTPSKRLPVISSLGNFSLYLLIRNCISFKDYRPLRPT